MELFASSGDIVLICGQSNQRKKRMLLVSYEIPSAALLLASGTRLLKVVLLTKKNVTQLEIIPMRKIVLLLGDGIVSILDIDSLTEITTVSSDATLFATSYDVPSSLFTPTSLSSSSFSAVVPNELRICVVSKCRQLRFFRWFPQQRRMEEDKNVCRTFDLIDTPRAIAFSRDRICIGYEKSYVIISITTGMIINELTFTVTHNPVINCLQDRTQWCIQMEANTMFLDSNFEPLYENGIVWKDIPSAVVQASPYVLALINQSIDICIFNGSQSAPVQQIPIGNRSTASKNRLWMDAQTKRIYVATSDDVFLLEPLPIHDQVQQCTAMQRYDLALILIRAALDISVSSSIHDQSRTNDGHAKGNLDISRMPKVVTFSNNKQVPTGSLSDISISDQLLDESALWSEYYRVGTMYAFQLFHKEQFQQAFAEFDMFLTDPAEIISLFELLSANTWLTNSHKDFRDFVEQYPHFSKPNDFVGVKLENALLELQRFLTELRQVFQTVYRRSPDAWLEVQSLVRNDLILKPIRDLLIIIETSLLKVFLLNKNDTLVTALLHDQDHCCLPSEVEKELTKHHRWTELVSFYQTENRHMEALQLMTNTDSLSSNDNILKYLSKLDNDQLLLVFQYVQPMIKSALQGQNNEELLSEILMLFMGESTPISCPTEQPIIRFDPIAVYDFLKDLSEDFAIRYLKSILLEPEFNATQQIINNRTDSVYGNQLQQLSDELNRLIKAKQF